MTTTVTIPKGADVNETYDVYCAVIATASIDAQAPAIDYLCDAEDSLTVSSSHISDDVSLSFPSTTSVSLPGQTTDFLPSFSSSSLSSYTQITVVSKSSKHNY